MEERKVLITENQLLFLLDKVEDCYKDECKKIIEKLLEEKN